MRLAPNPRRTLVAMSGGVDSAAAAQLALDAGDEVLAVTLELWSDPATDGERSCCSPQAVTGARALAHRMGIPHLTLDLRERFRAEVVDGFIDGYAEGRTPNPCVRCNGEVRFDAMLELAGALGAARLATGHYARIARDEHGPLIRAARDPRKDQSYMLARLDPDAARPALVPARRADQGRGARARARRRPAGGRQAREPGPLLRGRRSAGAPSCAATAARGCAGPARSSTRDGRVLGRHDGQHEFTVGQRRGLNVGGREPLYVLGKDAATNRVTVGPRAALATRARAARGRPPAPARRRGPSTCGCATTRRPLRVPRAPRPTAARLELELAEPAEAVAPGQLACLMRDDCVVGEGTIA